MQVSVNSNVEIVLDMIDELLLHKSLQPVVHPKRYISLSSGGVVREAPYNQQIFLVVTKMRDCVRFSLTPLPIGAHKHSVTQAFEAYALGAFIF